ncbi:MAG: AAA family ATPase [Minisyncoccia bacterium]
MLKSIEITGFKSFGKKVGLDFTKPISAIVGPNGSGKSNAAEAFRFVLGEQSIKSMRGKRAEDLIFNGGKDASRANRASVKVVFDNRKRLLNLDFDEVVFERAVHRDSVSEYFINGSPARLKDISELLAGAHIGASGHHIISQGEADRILNANPKERREMIEDALGLKIYQYKKIESERKLEKTAENIASVESLRREIAPHIKFLKKQVEKIEKTIELRAELIKLYTEYFKREDLYLKHAKEKLAVDKKGPTEKMHALDQELAEAKKVLSASQNKDEKSDEIIRLEGDLNNVRREKDTTVREIGRLEGEISSLDRLLTKQKDLASKALDHKVPLAEVENIAKEAIAVADEAIANENIAELKLALERVREIFVSFLTKKKSENPTQDFSETEGEIAKLREVKKTAEDKLKVLADKEKTYQSDYNNVRVAIEKEKDSNRDAEKTVFRIMAEQNELHSVMSILKNTEEKLHMENEALQNELREAGVLVGVAALHYKDIQILNAEGAATTPEIIATEPRNLQVDRRHNLERLKIRLEDSGVGSGEDVMKEYKETTERDAFLAKELEDLLKSSASLTQLIKELDEKLDNEFHTGIDKINVQFQHFFTLMFGGGQAKLSLIREPKRKKRGELEDALAAVERGEDLDEEESEPEFEEKEGLDIEVNLPRKKIKGLIMLSGGERALTSIALIFAVSQVNPPPFIILDETDAALDEANSRKYGDMIENLSKYSQLILITHNRETMSRAGIIYGVTMGGDGVSKILSIQFDEAVAVAK